jgi:MFS family permease
MTFLVAAATLWLMQGMVKARSGAASHSSTLNLLKEALRVVAGDPVLIGIILVTCLVNLLFAGPLAVGIPALAATRFSEGAAALGVIVSALGAGSLAGAGLSGALHPRRVGLAALVTILAAGLGLAGLGLASNLALAAVITLATGIGIGYTNVLLISSLQKRISPELRGRVMSLMLMGSMGATPLSNALAGVLVDINLQLLFLGVGLLLVALGLIVLSLPYARRICYQLG